MSMGHRLVGPCAVSLMIMIPGAAFGAEESLWPTYAVCYPATPVPAVLVAARDLNLGGVRVAKGARLRSHAGQEKKYGTTCHWLYFACEGISTRIKADDVTAEALFDDWAFEKYRVVQLSTAPVTHENAERPRFRWAIKPPGTPRTPRKALPQDVDKLLDSRLAKWRSSAPLTQWEKDACMKAWRASVKQELQSSTRTPESKAVFQVRAVKAAVIDPRFRPHTLISTITRAAYVPLKKQVEVSSDPYVMVATIISALDSGDVRHAATVHKTLQGKDSVLGSWVRSLADHASHSKGADWLEFSHMAVPFAPLIKARRSYDAELKNASPSDDAGSDVALRAIHARYVRTLEALIRGAESTVSDFLQRAVLKKTCVSEVRFVTKRLAELAQATGIRALQARFAQLPALPVNSVPRGAVFRKVDLSGSAVLVDGTRYCAFRFQTPSTPGELVWSFSSAESWMDSWYIQSAHGTMKGFRYFESRMLPADVPGVGAKGRKFIVQRLPSENLQKDTGYLIWFKVGKKGKELLARGAPLVLTVSVNVLPSGVPTSYEHVFPMLHGTLGR